jgi:glycosyltransferase involved in cell wall biosynthesis
MTQRPVVALVCDAIHPYSRGGREIRYHELSRRLAPRADIHIFTMHWWTGPRIRTEDGVTYHAISPLFPLYQGNRRSLKQALLFALACLRLLRHRFDVLEADHIPYFQLFVLRAVATLKRTPFIVTWHEVWSRAYWRQYLGLAGWAAWFAEGLAMRLPDHIIAASPGTADRLRETLGDQASVTVAPNGIDFDAIRSAYAYAVPSDLVAVGRLLDHKRIDLLLDVVARLHADGIPVTCRVIGDGPERETLHGQAEKLGIDHAVDFRHDVAEQKDLYAFVKAAKVFVSVSEREGFGIAVLEALACSIPVVTTSAPDNLAQHLVARSAFGTVCEPSAESVATALKRLVAGGSQPAVTGSDDNWLSDYDWDTTADRVATAYRSSRAPGSTR